MMLFCRSAGCIRGFRSGYMRRSHERDLHGLKFPKGRPDPLLGPETPEGLKHGKCWSGVEEEDHPWMPVIHGIEVRLPPEKSFSEMIGFNTPCYWGFDGSEFPLRVVKRYDIRPRYRATWGENMRLARGRLKYAAQFALCA